MATGSRKDTQVVFELDGSRFSLPAAHVLEMVRLPPVSALPGAPPHVRGAAELRGRVLPVLDLRLLFGMESARTETLRLVEMLRAREEDHGRWVAELERAVRDRSEFTLETDPTRCPFGRWYYSFRTENATVSYLVSSLEAPHREVHHLAERARRLVAEGKEEEALGLVEGARDTTLATLRGTLRDLYEILLENGREIGLVVSAGGRHAMVVVDAVSTVEPLSAAGGTTDPALAGVAAAGHFAGFGRMRGDGSLVLAVDPEKLLVHATPAPAPPAGDGEQGAERG